MPGFGTGRTRPQVFMNTPQTDQSPSEPQAIPAARVAALTAVEQALPISGKPGQDIQPALDNALRVLHDPRDKGLATELSYGFLRFKGRMDHLVRRHLAKPERTHPLILRVLGMAAFELTHLGGIPPHATLSWAVDAVKSRLGQASANVANAVLRRIQDLGPDALNRAYYEHGSTSRAQALSIWYSCPEWLVRLWLRDYGDRRTHDLLEAQLLPPLTGVRVNALHERARPAFDYLVSQPGVAYAEYPPFLAYDPAKATAVLPDLVSGEREGLLSRQSVAVGDIMRRLDSVNWPEPIWDSCAGRGGKTAVLLEQGHERVWASDVNARRLRGLRNEMKRLHLPQIPAFLTNAATACFREAPATILVDAPCSGLGVLSRRPDAKWKRTQTDITNLANIQRAIIHGCAEKLPVGGLLVYMTCTMTRDENERQGEIIESLGFTREILAGWDDQSLLREFFYGGVWKKNS